MNKDNKKIAEIEFIEDDFVNDEIYSGYDDKEVTFRELNSNKKVLNKNLERDQKDDEELINDIMDMQQEHNKETIEDVAKTIDNENKAKAFISDCKDYLSSKEFDDKCNELSKLHNIASAKIADTFSRRVLGTIADTLGIVINVTYNACNFLIKLLGKLLQAGCGLLCSLAAKLVGIFTLGYTCKKIVS